MNTRAFPVLAAAVCLGGLAGTANAETFTYTGAQNAMNQAQAPVATYDTVDWNITSGYFGTSGARNQTYANPNLIFTAVAQNNGWAEAVTRFSSDTTVTGNGAFSTITAGLGQDFVFAGNMQGYTGNISMADSGDATLTLGGTGSNIVQYGGETAGGNTALGTISSDGTGNWIDNVAGSGSITGNNIVFNYGTDASYDYVKVTNAIAHRDSVSFIGNANVLASGVISGGGKLNKSGTGTLTLSGPSTFSGNVALNAGILKFGVAGAGGAGGRNATGPLGVYNDAVTKCVVASGATLDINGFDDTCYGLTIAGNGTSGQGAYINSGANTSSGHVQMPNITLSADASIGGSGNLYMIAPGYGPNTLDLANSKLTKVGINTFYLANTTVTAGTVQVSGGKVSQSVASDGSAAAFVLDNTAGVALDLNNLAFSAGSLAGGGETGGNVTMSGALTVGALDTSTTYAGVISGGGALTKTGAGTMTLSNANTYTGSTTVSEGTLKLTNGSALGGSTFAGGAGTLELDSSVSSHAFTFGGLSGSYNLALQDNAANPITLTVGGNNKAATYSGNLTGTGNVVKNGSANWVLQGDNTFTGSMTVNSGFVVLDSATADGAYDLALNGGKLALGTSFVGGSATIGSLSGNSTSSTIDPAYGATEGTRTLSVNQTADGTYAGTIADAGTRLLALTKSGAATLTLTGNNSYTGATTISAGTLALSGSGDISESAVVDVASGATLDVSALAGWTVAGGQTLKGNGTVDADDGTMDTVTVNGKLAPGHSIGTLTILGSLTLLGASDFEIDRAATPLTSDLAAVSGLLTYGGTLNVSNTGGALQLGDTFDLFDWGTLEGTFETVNLPDLTAGLAWRNDLLTDGTITVIPEPASALALSLLLSSVLVIRRRGA